MRRPLVWVGIAYVIGEVWAATGLPIWTGALMAAIGTGMILFIRTGSKKRRLREKWPLYLLPVFFLSGFVSFCRASDYPAIDSRFEEQAEVTFYGKISDWEEKETSIVCLLKDAQVMLIASEANANQIYEAGLLVYLDKEDGALAGPGDVISGKGELEKLEKASNPGQFDAKTYYHARGIDYTLWPDEMAIVSRSNTYVRQLAVFRQRWLAVYSDCLQAEDAGVLGAMLLGDKHLLDADLQSLYQAMGIIHILAISGLHIAMIGMGIFKVVRRLGAGLRLSACAASFLVLSYGVMTGAGPSTMRAMIMFFVQMGAVYFGRSYDMLSAVSLAALIIFWRQPLMITQAGVQFSFAAVLSIGVLWPAAKRLILGEKAKRQHRKTDRNMKSGKHAKCGQMAGEWLLEHIGPSAAVTIGTLPLTAFYYGEVPLFSLFLNMIVIPAMGLVVPIGLATGLVGMIFMPAAVFLGGSLHVLLGLNTLICEKMAKWPMAVWSTGSPPLAMMIGYYGVLGIWLAAAVYTDFRRRRMLLILVLCSLILIPVRRLPPMVAFLDVGQGDCIFIRSPSGETWLVDGGSSDVSLVGKYRIQPFLQYYGESRVDYACVSHGDADHYSGIQELLEASAIRHLVLTEASRENDACKELAALAKEKHIAVIDVESGDRWQTGGWQFECLYPAAEMTDCATNDQSMVLRLEAADRVFLFTGDISSEAEKKLDEMSLTGTDVLKVAHHGSKSSSSEAFLEAAGADLAIISCGKHNRYGHPAAETMERLEKAEMKIYQTMTDGAVLMLYQNGKFHIRAYLNR